MKSIGTSVLGLSKNFIIIRYHLFSFIFIFSLILDNERWKQADVPSELQSLVDCLVDGKNHLNF